MHIQTGRFETQHASKYLQQLCKHFAHKVEVEYTSTAGQAALPSGPATLEANEQSLIVRLTAQDDVGMGKARAIIDVHLKKFAFREAFEEMAWGPMEKAV
ncbi:DUF2218 domain-containing protein [Celeribacter sp. ULVN23_4]